MIFVNSMSDLFHDDVPDEYIERVSEVMATARWHTFQLLTKRSKRMSTLLRGRLRRFGQMEHIWWGVSVENRKHGLPRIADLQKSEAKMQFLSIEPLLEDLGKIDLNRIRWAIVGGESGPGARPLDPGWVRSIRDQCASNRVPFFFKQWGGVRKKEAGRILDGKMYDGFPLIKRSKVPDQSTRKSMIADHAGNGLLVIA
jgi:protein gp37